MANDILSEFEQKQLSQFKSDFLQLARVSYELDRCYGKSQYEISGDINEFEAIIRKFNRKYADLKLKIAKAAESLHLKVYAHEKSASEFFANSASRISGLKAIGITGFNQAETANTERFSAMIGKIRDALFVTYSDLNSGTSTLAAVYDKKEKAVEILYQINELYNPNSADFKVCAYYALRKKVDNRVKIDVDLSVFGFWSIMKEDQKDEWLESFNPRFQE